ncbi:MAG: DNA alkylation repair protein [archaeon]
MLSKLKSEMKKLASPEKAKAYQWFFKTGKGQYGEGDQFIGLTMPEIRVFAKKYLDLSLKDTVTLLHSKIHEHRMTALVILTMKFEKADEKGKKEIYDFYLKNTEYINNWDLVDVTVHKIVGEFLVDKDRKILYKLAKSKDLWERRISMIACFAFLRRNDFKDALKIAEILVYDKHDLIHKAVGWMLREIGKKDQPTEEKFLKKHHKVMPRTMLRYSIERFDEKKRKFYMEKD